MKPLHPKPLRRIVPVTAAEVLRDVRRTWMSPAPATRPPLTAKQLITLVVIRRHLATWHEPASAALLARRLGICKSAMRGHLRALTLKGYILRPHRRAPVPVDLPAPIAVDEQFEDVEVNESIS